MHKLINILILSAILSLPLYAQEQDEAANWLSRIDSTERVGHSYSEIRQIITTSGGEERTLSARSWSAEVGDLSLMEYTDPPRVKGDKILMRNGGDNIWYYMKRRDVIRHFSGHTRRQSAMGSDFSYEDLSQGTMTEDYRAKMSGYENLDGVMCVKLKLYPTESGPSYDHLILWAGIDDALTRKIEYYDEDGFLKTLYFSNIQIVEGRKMALKMEMVNERESTRTSMIIDKITFRLKPVDWIFTKEALSREIPQ